MSSSLQSGVSGMRAHQRMLEVVGNNLANLNTTAFKGARVLFADQLSQTISQAQAPGGTEPGSQGGVNPNQVGLGVNVASIQVEDAQGSFSSTGRNLDLAIQGEGFFVVRDGAQSYYTRAGTMEIDADGYLVHSTSGLRASSVNNTDIQVSGNDIPAAQTANVNFTGNLSADARPPAAEVQASLTPFQTRATAVAGTPAAGGPPATYTIPAGSDFTIQVGPGAIQSVSLTAGAQTPAAIAAEINAATTGVRASVRNDRLVIQSDGSGASAQFTLADGTNTPLASVFGYAGGQIGSPISGGAASGATDLNDLGSTTAGYVTGDTILVGGRDEGTPINPAITFTYGTDGTTLADLAAVASTAFGDAAVAVDTNGNLTLTAGTVGDRDYAMTLQDGGSNSGTSNFTPHALGVTVDGFDGDQVRTAVDVFDSLGRPHRLELDFSYTGSNSWDLNVSSSEAGVTVTQDTVTGITFSTDGSFSGTGGVPVIQMSFDPALGSLVDDLNFQIDFGTAGQSNGLTMLSGESSAAVTSQDGNPPGKLASLSFTGDGQIVGIYDNGLQQDLEQLKLVTFANPAGLSREGGNLWSVTPNSGQEMTTGLGDVVSGVLEGSNIDTALEFTRLIVAQRGFQVNARTITTTDEMLQELANLVR